MATICHNCGAPIVTGPARSSQQNPCPSCSEYGLVELPSMNRKVCFSCHSEFDWHLKPDQKSVLIKGLYGSRDLSRSQAHESRSQTLRDRLDAIADRTLTQEQED